MQNVEWKFQLKISATFENSPEGFIMSENAIQFFPVNTSLKKHYIDDGKLNKAGITISIGILICTLGKLLKEGEIQGYWNAQEKLMESKELLDEEVKNCKDGATHYVKKIIDPHNPSKN